MKNQQLRQRNPELKEESMTVREKCIIETILVEIGLEPLYVGANDQEPKTKPVTVVKTSR